MSYSQDVETISQMFDGMDKAVIQAVYSVNNNNLERTIDNLLAMNSAGEQQQQSTQNASSNNNTFRNNNGQRNDNIPISSSLAEARALEQRRRQNRQGTTSNNKDNGRTALNPIVIGNTTNNSPASKWRNPLPPDFLRLAPEFIEARSRSSSQPQKMDLRDEELARMLQNEIFREQLKEDPLFNRLMAQDREQQRLRAERQRVQEMRRNNNNGNQQSEGSSTSNDSGTSWFASMGDGLKSFISGKYKDSRKRRQKQKERRRQKQNEGEDTSLLSTANDEYDDDSDDETDEENVPLFDENHDDGLGEGFELGTWKPNKSNNNNDDDDDVLSNTPKSSPNNKKKLGSNGSNKKQNKKAFTYGGGRRQNSLDDVDDLL